MNKYRTTPGLGPSKATANTTCQKCLAKGHYSYECKSSLQSRPYASRASRTQQLRNPKLKPALAETKMSEPVLDSTTRISQPREGAVVDRSKSHSLSPEPLAKRRRTSLSASSVSSVSTISTNASKSEHGPGARRSASPRVTQIPRSRSRSRPRSKSPHRKRHEPSSSRSRSPPRFDSQRRRGSHGHQDPAPHSGDSEAPHDSADRRHGGRRSRSPPPKPAPGSSEHIQHQQPSSAQSGPYRQRSLSPFSKRLALTQAMNAGR